jgi:hypothetical protein
MPGGGGDCFCEYHKSTTYTVADGSSHAMGVDEAYLYAKASYIYDTQQCAQRLGHDYTDSDELQRPVSTRST